MKITINNAVIEVSEKDVEDLKRQLLDTEKSPFELKHGDAQYEILSGGMVCRSTHILSEMDKSAIDCGSMYATKEAAERELALRKAIVNVKRWIHEKGCGVKHDKKASAYYVYKDYDTGKFIPDACTHTKRFSPFGYVKDVESCKEMVKECESDLHTIFDSCL